MPRWSKDPWFGFFLIILFVLALVFMGVIIPSLERFW